MWVLQIEPRSSARTGALNCWATSPVPCIEQILQLVFLCVPVVFKVLPCSLALKHRELKCKMKSTGSNSVTCASLFDRALSPRAGLNCTRCKEAEAASCAECPGILLSLSGCTYKGIQFSHFGLNSYSVAGRQHQLLRNH